MSWHHHIGKEIPLAALPLLGWYDAEGWLHEDYRPAEPELRYGVVTGHDFFRHGTDTTESPEGRVLCCETLEEAQKMAPLVGGIVALGIFIEDRV